MFAKILKFNPNHDENGRFSSSDGAASVESKAPIGMTFVSPNVGENTSMGHAVSALGSNEQAQFVSTFDKVDKMLGSEGAQVGVLGAWADGAENTVLQLSSGMSPEKLLVSAAMKGYLAEQKAVITFRAGSGDAKVHSFSTSMKDPKALSDLLVEHGIPYHTLVPQSGGFQVVAFNPESKSKDGKDLSHNITQFTQSLGVKHEYMKGSGGFLGSWDTREEGRAEYSKVINAYLDKNPSLKPQWDAMVKDMQPRVMKFAQILRGVHHG